MHKTATTINTNIIQQQYIQDTYRTQWDSKIHTKKIYAIKHMYTKVKSHPVIKVMYIVCHVTIVFKSESLKLLETYGPVQACNGLALL
jgi:hypothetical protein